MNYFCNSPFSMYKQTKFKYVDEKSLILLLII